MTPTHPTAYEAEVRVRVRLEASSEDEVRELLARHIHRMVKYREAESTEVIPLNVREIVLDTREADL
jgi:hypothetical protein